MVGRMVTLDSDIFNVCQKVETLEWSGDETAKRLLNQAATFVKPIMANRKWKVLRLSEFYPQRPGLLGLNTNHGQHVHVRLRSPRDRGVFLPYESIVQTLLHELCHNEIGPHNAEFYRLLDEVTREAEKLPANRRGASDAGHKLSKAGRNPDIVDRRRLAAAAAEKRAQRAGMFKSGRLGGGEDGIYRVCDPREMAFNAVCRRLEDDKWCGTSLLTEYVTEGEESRPEPPRSLPPPVIVIGDDSGAEEAEFAGRTHQGSGGPAADRHEQDVIELDRREEVVIELDGDSPARPTKAPRTGARDNPLAGTPGQSIGAPGAAGSKGTSRATRVRRRDNPVAAAAIRRMGQM